MTVCLAARHHVRGDGRSDWSGTLTPPTGDDDPAAFADEFHPVLTAVAVVVAGHGRAVDAFPVSSVVTVLADITFMVLLLLQRTPMGGAAQVTGRRPSEVGCGECQPAPGENDCCGEAENDEGGR